MKIDTTRVSAHAVYATSSKESISLADDGIDAQVTRLTNRGDACLIVGGRAPNHVSNGCSGPDAPGRLVASQLAHGQIDVELEGVSRDILSIAGSAGLQSFLRRSPSVGLSSSLLSIILHHVGSDASDGKVPIAAPAAAGQKVLGESRDRAHTELVAFSREVGFERDRGAPEYAENRLYSEAVPSGSRDVDTFESNTPKAIVLTFPPEMTGLPIRLPVVVTRDENLHTDGESCRVSPYVVTVLKFEFSSEVLGSVRAVLEKTDDSLSVTLQVARPDVAAMLHGNRMALADELEQSGVSVSSVDVIPAVVGETTICQNDEMD